MRQGVCLLIKLTSMQPAHDQTNRLHVRFHYDQITKTGFASLAIFYVTLNWGTDIIQHQDQDAVVGAECVAVMGAERGKKC